VKMPDRTAQRASCRARESVRRMNDTSPTTTAANPNQIMVKDGITISKTVRMMPAAIQIQGSTQCLHGDVGYYAATLKSDDIFPVCRNGCTMSMGCLEQEYGKQACFNGSSSAGRNGSALFRQRKPGRVLVPTVGCQSNFAGYRFFLLTIRQCYGRITQYVKSIVRKPVFRGIAP
jgi:hypothetical protein